MNVLICNSLEKKGGAAKSSLRIKEAVGRIEGINPKYLYTYKNGEEKTALKPKVDAIPKILFSKDRRVPFSSSLFPFGGKSIIKRHKADLLHLNYINMGMFSIKDIGEIDLPIVWTIHDAWPFTGGCHLTMDCPNYKKVCSRCPALGSNKTFDLSTYVFREKEKHWKHKDIVFVCPSKWMANKAKESSLLRDKRILVIKNPIDTDIYKPIDQSVARKKFSLSKNRNYLLFGSVNPLKDSNKGFELLRDALKNLRNPSETTLLVFGTDALPPIGGIQIKTMGYITDESELASLYSAVNVTVVPSISENLPNVLIESLACGTPGVAFKVGGIPEIIQDNTHGRVVEPFDTNEFAEAIDSVLRESHSFDRKHLHSYVERDYGYKTIGGKYAELYKSVLVS